MLRRIVILAAAAALLFISASAQDFPTECSVPHPRLIIRNGDIERLRSLVASDPCFADYHERIVGKSEKLLLARPQIRKKTGKRLLTVSRRVLEMTAYCSYMYFMTGDLRYVRRAEREMLAAASFTDWNPSHFLDVAEMTAALAIGYDWLYDVLEPANRDIIARAIIDKGLHASANEKHYSFYKRANNWNQVCNAGLVMGALAVYELIPEEALKQVVRSVKSNPVAQACYGPEGVYPEGYGYWDYGTTFEVLLIESLRTALGTSFGLEKAPGFLRSAEFMQAMKGPTGAAFNYSDCGKATNSCNPLLYWFAKESGDASVLWLERNMRREGGSLVDSSRLLPVILILASSCDTGSVDAPRYKAWFGNGNQPVFMYRSDWNSHDASYLALKGGSASINHAHMDAGSFVYEWGGIRWAEDAGRQDYYSLEKTGLNIWSRTQESDRWKVFRYNNTAHNTLTVNDGLHVMKGNARIVRTADLGNGCEAEVDLTPVLKDVKSAVRKFSFRDDGHLKTEDTVEAKSEPCSVKWLMWTHAKAEVGKRNTVVLTMKGKQVVLRADGSSKIKASILDNTPPASYDADNGNSRRVCFEMQVKPNRKGTVRVEFIPQP